jgi:hypothetical protein
VVQNLFDRATMSRSDTRAKPIRSGTRVKAPTPLTMTARVITADEAQPRVAAISGVQGFKGRRTLTRC